MYCLSQSIKRASVSTGQPLELWMPCRRRRIDNRFRAGCPTGLSPCDLFLSSLVSALQCVSVFLTFSFVV